MTPRPAILLLGPTGSGKTPLGDLLQAQGLHNRPCRHFDFGQQLRSAASASKPPANLTPSDVTFIRSVLQSGALLEGSDFHIAEKLLRSFLASPSVPPDALIIMNGLPRHVHQAHDLQPLVDIRTVIELICSPSVTFQRIQTNAGGDRTHRTDDSLPAVTAKLHLYNNRTKPLVEYFKSITSRIVSAEIHASTAAIDIYNQLPELELPHMPPKK